LATQVSLVMDSNRKHRSFFIGLIVLQSSQIWYWLLLMCYRLHNVVLNIAASIVFTCALGLFFIHASVLWRHYQVRNTQCAT